MAGQDSAHVIDEPPVWTVITNGNISLGLPREIPSERNSKS